MDKINTVNILGINIAAVNLPDTIKLITENIDDIRGKYICVSNVHTTVMASDSESYKSIQNSSLMSLPDGKPLSIIGKARGFVMDRVTGPDLMEGLFKISIDRGYNHYFYGNSEENLNKFILELVNLHPMLNIVGYKASVFRSLSNEENDELLNEMNQLNADYIWIALGAPNQEIFMHKNLDRTNGLMVGIGGAMNVISGVSPRAPKWMQNCSLEWLFRLIDDPKRLWKRYLITNTKFLYRIMFK